MRKIVFAALLLSAVAAYAGEPSNEITTENVIAQMNAHRAEHGLPPLQADERLMKAAADRMKHMEDEAYWSHTSPDGVTPFVWVRLRNYDFKAAGENLATGFETARLLVTSWMESPGHRANILSAMYEDCGIAIIDGAVDGPSSGKSIVVLFAKKQPEFQLPVLVRKRD
ncbi:MAG TPA: CAP domain-containing protein [Thermoanaerobaculia bacterium]|jgi:uncharacterized protein YkwD|nr:CAP domain-containing protein [Thermoanaerobaculia bacterium]